MKNFVYLIVVLGLFHSQANGQTPESDSLQLGISNTFFNSKQLVNEWDVGTNPTGTVFSPVDQISRISAGFALSNDELKAAMNPGETGAFNLQTNGVKRIGKVMYTGQFGYSNSQYNDLLYNGTLDFDGKSIYLVGDTVGGQQKKEGFQMMCGMALPLTKRISVGLNAHYNTYVGGKMSDPRNLNKISDLQLNAGVILSFENVAVGVNGGPIWKGNQVSVKVMKDAKHNIFKFQGLGFYEYEFGITSLDYLYENNGYFASMQVNTQGSSWGLFQSLSAQKMKNVLYDSYRFKAINGISDFTQLKYQNALLFRNAKHYHELKANVLLEKIKGTEVSQEYVSNEYGEDTLYIDLWRFNKQIDKDYIGALDYSLYGLGSNLPFSYRLDVGVMARYSSSTHYPDWGEYNAFSVFGYAGYKKYICLGSWVLAPQLGVGLRVVPSKSITYQSNSKFFAAIPEMNYRYISASYAKVNAGASLSKNLKHKLFKEAFLEMECSYLSVIDDQYGLSNLQLFINTGVVF